MFSLLRAGVFVRFWMHACPPTGSMKAHNGTQVHFLIWLLHYTQNGVVLCSALLPAVMYGKAAPVPPLGSCNWSSQWVVITWSWMLSNVYGWFNTRLWSWTQSQQNLPAAFWIYKRFIGRSSFCSLDPVLIGDLSLGFLRNQSPFAAKTKLHQKAAMPDQHQNLQSFFSKQFWELLQGVGTLIFMK